MCYNPLVEIAFVNILPKIHELDVQNGYQMVMLIFKEDLHDLSNHVYLFYHLHFNHATSEKISV